LVVLPKALEETQGSALEIALMRCDLQNFAECSASIDGAEQPAGVTPFRPRRTRI
jgi:hypothetical protein